MACGDTIDSAHSDYSKKQVERVLDHQFYNGDDRQHGTQGLLNDTANLLTEIKSASKKVFGSLAFSSDSHLLFASAMRELHVAEGMHHLDRYI